MRRGPRFITRPDDSGHPEPEIFGVASDGYDQEDAIRAIWQADAAPPAPR